MGILRKIFKPLTKETEQMINHARSILKQDKIEHGEKVLPPKHPTDKKNFDQAQKDKKIREEIERRRDDVIQNVNRITIKSFDPPERPKSDRPLPSRENEYERMHDPKFEYGFYEPPLDKMQPGKLMLREVMELLYAKTEIDLKGAGTEEAENVLQSHPATSRVNSEDVDDLYKYYRPFIRRDDQYIADRRDLALISDYMNNRGEFGYELMLSQAEGAEKHLESMKRMLNQKFSDLDDRQKKEVAEAVSKKRIEEDKRLEGTLGKEFSDETLGEAPKELEKK